MAVLRAIGVPETGGTAGNDPSLRKGRAWGSIAAPDGSYRQSGRPWPTWQHFCPRDRMHAAEMPEMQDAPPALEERAAGRFRGESA